MSLILDALKRAERERSGAHLPASADLPSQTLSAVRSFRYWRLTGVLVLLAVSVLLAWTFLHNKPGRAKANRSVVTAAAPPSASAPPVPHVIPGTEAVASLDDITTVPLEEEAAMLPAPSPPRVAAVTPAPIAESPGQPETPDAQPQAAPSVAAPATEPVMEPEPAAVPPPVLTQPAPLRKFREMPPEYRADFPALTVEVHVHEREAAQRFVMINGRRYRQGERLAEGPAIIEIVRDGIVLEFRGEKVLYTLTR